jgi:putative phosphoribosyl transferase
MAIFADRTAAGSELADALAAWRGADAVVFGIPRGGVVVAAEVARILGLPLDVAVVRKLGAPSQEEFAVGAIAEGVRVVHPDAVRAGGVTPEQLVFVEDLERAELDRRRRAFPRTSGSLKGRIAIVVDDGVATGATAEAACLALRAESPDRVLLAVPVAPFAWRPDPGTADEYVCPHQIMDFWAVGQFYDDFTQTTDGEVARLLSDASTGSATDGP